MNRVKDASRKYTIRIKERVLIIECDSRDRQTVKVKPRRAALMIFNMCLPYGLRAYSDIFFFDQIEKQLDQEELSFTDADILKWVGKWVGLIQTTQDPLCFNIPITNGVPYNDGEYIKGSNTGSP